MSPLVSPFFGLTSAYRALLFTQIHELVYHGGGGFIHSEVYNMPIWMRRFHIEKISEFNKKQNNEIDKISKKSKSLESSSPKGPNIPPSSTYNF